MKKICSPECKEHYLDICEELISPEMLADKLEAFDNIRRSLPSGPRRHVPNERSPLRCYGCGKQGVIKSRDPTCNLNASQRTDVATNHINAYTAQTRSPPLTLIDITFCGIKGRVRADTGSSHSIAGERMFQIFKDKMSPVKKKILRKEIEGLLEKDIIEECEYPYEDPVGCTDCKAKQAVSSVYRLPEAE
ncbi:uncharacterized protein TNCV_1203631 [Trichonephila clavipes]|nr:uncharacterized protein TNCV_1203631 [Trichonephila clavipes]